jgi:hypothetical protein
MSIDDYTRWPRGLDYVRAGLDDLFRSNPYLAQVGAELADWGPEAFDFSEPCQAAEA